MASDRMVYTIYRRIIPTKSNFQVKPESPNLSPDITKNFQIPEFTTGELNSTRIGKTSCEDKPSECQRCLWPFLKLSRCFGICPLIKRGNHLTLGRRNPYWLSIGFGLIIQGIMVGNSLKALVVAEEDASEAVQLSVRLNDVTYYTHTFLNNLFMIWKVKQLPGFLDACKRIELICKKYKKEDDNLVKHAMLLFFFFASTQLFGNIIFFYAVGVRNNATSILHYFQIFNTEYGTDCTSYYAGMFISCANFYCDMGWTFGDIFMALISLVLGRYFIRLNKAIAERGLSPAKELEEVRSDHRKVSRLVKLCNEIFSPLFLLTYVGNIGYLFTRLYTGLKNDLNNPHLVVKGEVIYAFIYQLLKILVPTWFAASLNAKAHQALDLVHAWPSMIEPLESNYRVLVIGRFVSHLINDPVGISGCGFFLISKNFLVTLISALITYEVVILQFQQSGIK